MKYEQSLQFNRGDIVRITRRREFLNHYGIIDSTANSQFNIGRAYFVIIKNMNNNNGCYFYDYELELATEEELKSFELIVC
jgi:hypothetical protein